MITNEGIRELTKALMPLATKIGQTGEFVYETYRRQVYVQVITENGGWILFNIFLLIPAIKIIKHFNHGRKKNPGDEDWVLGLVLSWILLSVVVFFILSNSTLAVARLWNPDYYVISGLLEQVRSQ